MYVSRIHTQASATQPEVFVSSAVAESKLVKKTPRWMDVLDWIRSPPYSSQIHSQLNDHYQEYRKKVLQLKRAATRFGVWGGLCVSG